MNPLMIIVPLVAVAGYLMGNRSKINMTPEEKAVEHNKRFRSQSPEKSKVVENVKPTFTRQVNK